ncbi:carboxypeptidase regulatory-like domain-containing protein [Blastopirellula sp. JC732]|uniref:Carboxypeptidase regulatory-like domain-containing protein n=1 Tax=Blastopirellula sediminis TaxID=2894196 RepID=A0A9X1SG94_9BACT|nr:carboxypeptidase regulatory-like domain-containing protein [Blastopirellula sediminis]MCC9608787.1 carboxypeptidase regulatory-like domain-containing protein [Blastopirellula sediminis]MCC9628436.1 carboxypeptidase regulatory-like domain-containing protein [Blastopirellula sediminis]
MTGPIRLLLVCTLFGLGAWGCAKSASDLPNLSEMSGAVTLDGKPVTNAAVSFESANGQVAFGNTDSEGRYELIFRDGAKGAEVGPNTVRIETVLEGPPAPNYRDPIPAKYNKASTLTVEVTPDAHTHDFALESK